MFETILSFSVFVIFLHSNGTVCEGLLRLAWLAHAKIKTTERKYKNKKRRRERGGGGGGNPRHETRDEDEIGKEKNDAFLSGEEDLLFLVFFFGWEIASCLSKTATAATHAQPPEPRNPCLFSFLLSLFGSLRG